MYTDTVLPAGVGSQLLWCNAMQILEKDFYFMLQVYFWGDTTIEYKKNMSGHETAKQKELNLVNRENEKEGNPGLGIPLFYLKLQ